MKNIKVNIPDGHVIDTENSDLEKGIITFKKEESKYPMELVNVFKDNNWKWDYDWDKYETFIRLVETCKEWNRIDAFDWESENKCSFIVTKNRKRVGLFSPDIAYWTHTTPFRFKNVETAELFLETFREEIELVKDLI